MLKFVFFRLGLRIKLPLVRAAVVDGQLLLVVAQQLTFKHFRFQPQVLDVLSVEIEF